jgi:hypothetical protein
MYAIGEMTGLQCIIFYNCLHYKLSEIQGSLEKQGPQKVTFQTLASTDLCSWQAWRRNNSESLWGVSGGELLTSLVKLQIQVSQKAELEKP